MGRTLGKDLKVGDKVFSISTGRTLTVQAFTAGYFPKSRCAVFKEGAEPFSIHDEIEYATVETRQIEREEEVR